MPNDLNTNLALILNGLGAMPSGSVGVRLSTQASATGVSNVGVAETDLLTYTLPANALNSNLQSVRITTWLTTAANVNNKTVKLYFGSTVVAFSAATALNAGTFRLNAVVIRTGATTQLSVGDMTASASGAGFVSALGIQAAPAETLSGAVVIKMTGQSGTGSNDVTAQAMLVEWLP